MTEESDQDLLRRLRMEYHARPDLSLTPAQAAQLLGIDRRIEDPIRAQGLLECLVEEQFLMRRSHDRYVRF